MIQEKRESVDLFAKEFYVKKKRKKKLLNLKKIVIFGADSKFKK